MKFTTQQQTYIRISALIFPAIIVMSWVSEAVGDGHFAMAGLGGLVAAIVMGVGYFLFQNRSLKVQVIASLIATVVLLVVIRFSLNTPTQKMKREIVGYWVSVPREDELDDVLGMWFAPGGVARIGFDNPHKCKYEIHEGELVLTENMKTSRMKILLLRNDSLRLATEDGMMLFIRE